MFRKTNSLASFLVAAICPKKQIFEIILLEWLSQKMELDKYPSYPKYCNPLLKNIKLHFQLNLFKVVLMRDLRFPHLVFTCSNMLNFQVCRFKNALPVLVFWASLLLPEVRMRVSMSGCNERSCAQMSAKTPCRATDDWSTQNMSSSKKLQACRYMIIDLSQKRSSTNIIIWSLNKVEFFLLLYKFIIKRGKVQLLNNDYSNHDYSTVLEGIRITKKKKLRLLKSD